jgi:hypothetical protein
MQRVYQFHHFGEGAETYRSPWGKATLREVMRGVCDSALCRRFRRSYSFHVKVADTIAIDTACRARRPALSSGADG